MVTNMKLIEHSFLRMKGNLGRSYFRGAASLYLLEIKRPAKSSVVIVTALLVDSFYDYKRVISGYVVQNEFLFDLEYWKTGRAKHGWCYKDRVHHLKLIEKWSKKVHSNDFQQEDYPVLKDKEGVTSLCLVELEEGLLKPRKVQLELLAR